MEFEAFKKIARIEKLNSKVITEKIDGNACVACCEVVPVLFQGECSSIHATAQSVVKKETT